MRHWIIYINLFCMKVYWLISALDEIAAISKTIFSDTFSWTKNFVFWWKVYCSLFLSVLFTIIQHWFSLDNGLAPNRWQAIIWTNANPIHWRIYEALGGDESIIHYLQSAEKAK